MLTTALNAILGFMLRRKKVRLCCALSEKFLLVILHTFKGEGFMLLTSYLSLQMLLYAFKYRDRHSIIADMLKAVAKSSKGSKKSHIMQRGNLNSVQINRYMDILLRNGFVIIDGYKYRLSTKGLRYLENIESELRVQWRR